MKIGSTIKQIRKKKGLTLKEASQLSGIQIATLSRMENDKMAGTLKSYILLAKSLGLTLSQLFAVVEAEGGL